MSIIYNLYSCCYLFFALRGTIYFWRLMLGLPSNYVAFAFFLNHYTSCGDPTFRKNDNPGLKDKNIFMVLTILKLSLACLYSISLFTLELFYLHIIIVSLCVPSWFLLRYIEGVLAESNIWIEKRGLQWETYKIEHIYNIKLLIKICDGSLWG